MIDKDILNADEVAEMLGISKQTVMKLVKAEKLPAVNLGGWRFSKKAILRFIETGGKETNE